MVASFVAPAIVATNQLDAKIHENTKRMILAPGRGAQGTVDCALVSNPWAACFNANRQDPLMARSGSTGRLAAPDLVSFSGLSVARYTRRVALGDLASP
jgi:hypothetical protein